MIVVSDASPIIALFEIGRLELLKEVFGEVIVTDVVAVETQMALPDWIAVRTDYNYEAYQQLCNKLDRGEASAIALTKSIKGATLLIDERKGRAVAARIGISYVGLLGVIVMAKKQQVVELGMPILNALIANGFRVSDSIIELIKARLGE